MPTRNIIIFGPTGAVGSAAAHAAHSHGANVILAMRYTSKTIPYISPQEEEGQSSRYKRVQADLTQPDSLGAAVRNTGATHAFIYAALHGTPDHMRASIEALKAAGIESVVVLSSLSVFGDIRAIPPTDFIGYAHAQVEVSVQEVFGPQGYVALRPAFFASNSLWWSKEIRESGEVRTAFPTLQFDYLSPEDIGAVAGTILAGDVKGAEGGNVVTLAGPESMSVADGINTIGKVIGKEVKVTKVSPEEGLQVMITKNGLPEVMAKTLVDQFVSISSDDGLFHAPGFQEARDNVEKYLQRPPMRFAQWVERNQEKFVD